MTVQGTLKVYGMTSYADVASAVNGLENSINTINTNLSGYATLSSIQSNNNAWTGTNTFNSSLPTSTLTPSNSTQLITKSYGDSNYQATITSSTALTCASLTLNSGNLTLSSNTPTSKQLGYNGNSNGAINSLTVTTTAQYSSLTSVTLPYAGIYIITASTTTTMNNAVTNFYWNSYFSNSGSGGNLSTGNAANYYTSVPTTVSLSLNNTIFYTATSSTLSVNLYLVRQIMSGGSGSGTYLSIEVSMSYIRIG